MCLDFYIKKKFLFVLIPEKKIDRRCSAIALKPNVSKNTANVSVSANIVLTNANVADVVITNRMKKNEILLWNKSDKRTKTHLFLKFFLT